MGSLSLLAPAGLALLAALVPLVVLYVLKIKRTRVLLPSVWLWRSAQRDLMARAPFRRLVAQLLLLVEVIALALLALAFARPVARSKALAGAHYAIVIDASASMSARSEPGDASRTRFDDAKRAAKDLLAALPPGAEVMVVEAGREARVASPLDRDRRRLASAIEDLRPLEVEGDLGAALALSVDRLRAFEGSRIVVVTDGNLAKPGALADVALPVEVVTVGAPIENAGVVRVDARTALDPVSKKDATEVFLVVASFAKADREVFVTLREDGASDVLASRRLLLHAGERAPVVLGFEPMPADIGKALVVDVSPHDAFELDDVAFSRVPESDRLSVVLATKGGAPSPWLERALTSDEGVELVKTPIESLGEAPIDRGALVVIDGACPADVGGGDLLFVHPPAGECHGTKVGDEVKSPAITSWDTADPRLRFLSLDGVSIARANKLTVESTKLELVRGRDGPLVTDASSLARAATLVGFDVGESDWPLKASFVLFVRNVVEQARAHRARGLVAEAKTGEPLRVSVPPDVSVVEITPPSGGAFTSRARAGLAVVPALARAGIYRVSYQGRSAGTSVVPVNVTSPAESDLRTAFVPPAASAVTLRAATDAPIAYRELGYVLALAALALLLFDVWWFTRRGGARPAASLAPIAPERRAP